MKQEDHFHWSKLEELSGKMTALLRANKVEYLHQRFIDAGIQLVYVESIEQGLQLVLKGRVYYAFGDNLALSETSFSDDEKGRLQFSESSFYSNKIGFFYNSECEKKLFVSP